MNSKSINTMIMRRNL